MLLYSAVHAGPKTQLGGPQSGFFKPLYQVLILSLANILATRPPAFGKSVAPTIPAQHGILSCYTTQTTSYSY